MSIPTISVRREIKPGQFVELTPPVEDGVQVREPIQISDVTANGGAETCCGHYLGAGDIIEVNAFWGKAAATVRSAS